MRHLIRVTLGVAVAASTEAHAASAALDKGDVELLGEVLRLADAGKRGGVSLAEFKGVFADGFPSDGDVAAAVARHAERAARALAEATASWQCPQCTFVNARSDAVCGVCAFSTSGRRECPKALQLSQLGPL